MEKKKRAGRLAYQFGQGSAEREPIDELMERLVPQVGRSEIQQLQSILLDAQRRIPREPRAFVRKFNRLLDVCCLRIRMENGDLGRLRCRTDRNGDEYIQLSGTRSGRQAFRGGRLRIAVVAEDYARRKTGITRHLLRVDEVLETRKLDL